MILLGLDFETQDDKPKTTRITEVGACLYDSDATAVSAKLKGLSSLCWEPEYPPQTPFIVELTGITDEMLKEQGRPVSTVFKDQLFPLMESCEVVVAHNKHFDQTVFEHTCRRLDLEPPRKPWLCTLTEFPWPDKYTCKKLSHLAYDHGLIVHPSTLHRAENDVDLMMKLILSEYDFKDVLAYWREPWVYLKANVLGPWTGNGGDGGVQTDIAKKLGFTWEKVRGREDTVFVKWWVTRIKESKFEPMLEKIKASASPFEIVRINGIN